jgi:hypothetical protein
MQELLATVAPLSTVVVVSSQPHAVAAKYVPLWAASCTADPDPV